MHIDQQTWDSVPHLFTGADYRDLAKFCVEAYKLKLREKLGPEGVSILKRKCAATLQSLKNAEGLSDSGETQFAFMLPEFIDNLLGCLTRDGNWPRTRPALLQAIVEEFAIGKMGQYGSSVKSAGTAARDDFGCALGSGDVD